MRLAKSERFVIEHYDDTGDDLDDGLMEKARALEFRKGFLAMAKRDQKFSLQRVLG